MLGKIIHSTAPKPIQHLIRSTRFLSRLLSIPVIVLAVLVAAFYIYYSDKVIPGVYVANVSLAGKNLKQAEQLLQSLESSQKLTLKYEKQEFSFDPQEAGLVYKPDKSALRAFQYGRKGSIRESLKQEFQAITRGAKLPLVYDLDVNKIDSFSEKIASQVDIPAIEPSVSLKDGEILVNPGKNGQEIDKNALKNQLYNAIAYHKQDVITIPVIRITPELSDEEVKILKSRAEKLLGKSINIEFEDKDYSYKDDSLVSLLEPLRSRGGVKEEKIEKLVSEIASGVNRSPQDARFEFADGRVKEFQPAKDGIEVEQSVTEVKISEALRELENTDKKELSFALPVRATKPEVSNEEVNDLGIKELIGQGVSSFKGSAVSRVHNIKLASARLNGILVKPGEEFSFDKALGEVSKSTGYQEAFVIKQGRTILDDGGGVCQVSTTFFRAAINTGLPILERHPHSYRVSYYEQGTKAGIDATVYPPSVDLKIKNDTSVHILVQTKLDLKNYKLTFEFYGTSDGRVAEISTPRIWDITPPPPDQYQDDPTLPAGTVKQVEKAISGAKAAFDYKVTRNGETLQKRTFYSNYRAWQAVYLRGTAQ